MVDVCKRVSIILFRKIARTCLTDSHILLNKIYCIHTNMHLLFVYCSIVHGSGTVNVSWEKRIKLFSPVEICIYNPQYNLQSTPLLYSTIKGADKKQNKTDLIVRHISRFDYDGEKASKHFDATQTMLKGLWWHWPLN